MLLGDLNFKRHILKILEEKSLESSLKHKEIEKASELTHRRTLKYKINSGKMLIKINEMN